MYPGCQILFRSNRVKGYFGMPYHSITEVGQLIHYGMPCEKLLLLLFTSKQYQSNSSFPKSYYSLAIRMNKGGRPKAGVWAMFRGPRTTKSNVRIVKNTGLF